MAKNQSLMAKNQRLQHVTSTKNMQNVFKSNSDCADLYLGETRS